jgi:3-deoxy-D-manno-octulosonic-acid transferase
VLFLFDIAYLLALPFVVLFATLSRLKGHPQRKDLRGRLGAGEELTIHPKRVLLHAVSVGEVNAIRSLVSELRANNYDVVICVTTDTGLQRAQELFAKEHTVTRFPFDFGFAIQKFLKRVKPTVIALVELEVWPNLVGLSAKKNIPVVVINGRLSERSYKRYKFVKFFLLKTFARLTAIGMQNEEYAARVRKLGGVKVSVHGTMKWDNATITNFIDGADELATDLKIDRNKTLIVAGSTTPEEHKLLLKSIPDNVQLLCAPRRPEWFDEAAQMLAPCNRRTSKERIETNRFLLDTIGELDKAYFLADIVVIGRSFSPMHGSDPVQSIAFGKPTIIGPNANDFKDMVEILVKGGGLIQCSKEVLKDQIASLLEDDAKGNSLVTKGREIIESQQGATRKYAQLIMENTP